jgi:hypothetical protein
MLKSPTFATAGVNFGILWPGQALRLLPLSARARAHDGVAARHGVSVEGETTQPSEAYAAYPEPREVPFSEAMLPPVGDVTQPRPDA